ncbi:YdcP family protein [Lapidilactobacillus mulanensis]|uniref:YdcP family protein n=2 Tax=Lactobacillaceae TaxID=33958 RepID=A0ABW4DLD8_9LACO|nr:MULTISPECIES: YdcP family protein [Lactobacillaceae]
MRLPEGIVLDTEKTFGVLKFSAQRRERFVQDEDGNRTNDVAARTFDLKSYEQGQMIQVSIPAEAGTKEFAYDQVVMLVNPVIDTVANADFRGADVSWYLKADNIVAANEKAKGLEKPANDKK